MKIGLMAPLANPMATPVYLRTLAGVAEGLGFHSIWVPEHVVLFDEYDSKYPYSSDGRIVMVPGGGPLEPFTALTFLAAHSNTIRLGTGICLVPQRNPVYTAKEVSNLDWLSGGRFDFGIGAGWLAEEFQALGVPFGQRGKRLRDYVGVMKSLWIDDVSEFEGVYYSLPPCRQLPKPIQRPHPPLHFGGESDAALERVADLGQGWYGFNLLPETASERIAILAKMLEARGRRRDEVSISITPPWTVPLDRNLVDAYRSSDVDQLIVTALSMSPDDLVKSIEAIAAVTL
jgi:probable F420-dependent oxidoreductase